MKKIILSSLFLIFLGVNLFCQKGKIQKVNVFMSIDFKEAKLLYDKPSGKVVSKLKHNFKDEDFVTFSIINKNDTMFYVEAYYEIKGFISKGWIKKDSTIGIYSRAYSKPLILYKQPDKNKGVQCEIKKYDPEMYIVTDSDKGWLKVKITLDGILYEGWMAPEMQCCNLYSTCS